MVVRSSSVVRLSVSGSTINVGAYAGFGIASGRPRSSVLVITRDGGGKIGS